MDNTINKTFKISRIVITILTFIIFNIMIIINQRDFFNIIPFIFAALTFAFSFPSSVISRKLISVGNSLKSKLLRILYYLLILPIISIVLAYIILFILVTNSNNLFIIFWIAIGVIGVVLPYIQTIIVLVINFFLKN